MQLNGQTYVPVAEESSHTTETPMTAEPFVRAAIVRGDAMYRSGESSGRSLMWVHIACRRSISLRI